MEVLFGFFMLASIVVAVMALFRRSPVRRWYGSRQHPGRAVVVTLVLWLIAAVALAPKGPSVDTATTTGTPSTSATPAPRPQATTPPVTTTPAESPTAPTTVPGTTERTTQQHASTPDGVPRDAQRVRVEQIVDGDTLEAAAVSSGTVLSGTAQVDVRLLEIDAPETKHPSEPEQCYGQEATEKLRELAPPGGTVWVQRDEELRDRYGRYLLYVWNHAGVFVNKAMVTEGFARPELYEPNDRHWKTIRDAGSRAQSAASGLWSACESSGAPEDTPPTSTTPEPTPQPAPEPAPEPSTAPEPRQELEQPVPGSEPGAAPEGVVSYPHPPDKDCSEIDESNFRVQEGDPHGFDADDDGIGCDS
ncbi:micrococcal nuclease [Prauserella isguenensis]|uniref:Micrococcal nuclease n=1 Tax=Prauserella isguenensis TaxID=1470180 RepID=A0A839RY74_9PSEU|nr:thermonuclease family protein [Prauserella isguenensis]MBB3049984.1 micrococcal nuclease [Prauserella isguenensis]